jgi:hypothetical protein
MTIAQVLTYLPAVGLVGLAVYQAVNQQDLTAASQSILQALAVFGIGGAVHSTAAAVTPPNP